MADNKTKKIFGKAAVNFIIGVALGALFLFTLVEGLTSQVEQNHLTALAYYFLSFLAGITAFYNYLRAKTLFNYAKLA